jgi:uncharacterized protein YecE (DUF72 family)
VATAIVELGGITGTPATETEGKALVGTYGFGFAEWAKHFYPKGVPEGERLRHYATKFHAVEMNVTYHRLPTADMVARWRDLTPEDFTITAKAPRFLVDAIGRLDATNANSIDDLAARLMGFVDLMRPLGPRLGPIVLQLSPTLCYPRGLDVLRELFGRVMGTADPTPRFAVEFRDPSWLSSGEPAALLRASGVTWVWNDMAPGPGIESPMPRAIDDPSAAKLTADDVAYVRLSGSHTGKDSHYTKAVDRRDELQRWADLVRDFLRNRPDRTAYVMLSDHYAGTGPDTARELQTLLA